MEKAYVLTGELRDGRSLVLDEAVPLAAGKVRVTVEAIAKAPGTQLSEATVSGVEKDADICGGDACIARTRVPVWVLEQARRLGATEADLFADYPSLTAADLGPTCWRIATKSNPPSAPTRKPERL